MALKKNQTSTDPIFRQTHIKLSWVVVNAFRTLMEGCYPSFFSLLTLRSPLPPSPSPHPPSLPLLPPLAAVASWCRFSFWQFSFVRSSFKTPEKLWGNPCFSKLACTLSRNSRFACLLVFFAWCFFFFRFLSSRCFLCLCNELNFWTRYVQLA